MQRGIVMVMGAAASWGTYSLFLRPTGLPGTVTAPLLFALVVLVSLPFALRGPRSVWDRRTVLLLLANGVFDALNILAFFGAIATTTIAIAVLTHYLAPVLIALAAPHLERTSARGTRPAAAVALVGLAIVLEPWHAPADGAALGALLGAASAICYAGNTFVLRQLGPCIGALRAVAYHSVISGVLLAPLLLLEHPPIEATDVALLAAAATLLSVLSVVVFMRGLARIGSALASVLTYVEPLVAVAIGVLVWGEPLSPFAIVGGALVLGAGLAVVRAARPTREPPATP